MGLVREGVADADPANWRPRDPATFGVYLQIFIGEQGDEASDSFEVLACSPNWLAAQPLSVIPPASTMSEGIVSGRSLLLMKRWDYSALRRALDTFVGSLAGRNWGDVANRIGRMLPWEYEYKYDADQDRLT
jgi:hypothetical protein